MEIKYINPETMAKPRGYSHAISVSGNRRTVYIGGQNAIDEQGNLIGKGLGEQTEQVLANIEKILKQAGGTLHNIVKLNIHVLQGQNPQDGFQAFSQRWGTNINPPGITVVFVAGLGRPGWLVEIDGMAEIEL